MARVWTCRKCGTRNPRTRQRCDCGRKRPAPRQPAHRVVLDIPYEWWVDKYGERCGICGNPPKPGQKLHRDHCHATGRARGLLCWPCNSRLTTRVDTIWLRKALSYLERG